MLQTSKESWSCLVIPIVRVGVWRLRMASFNTVLSRTQDPFFHVKCQEGIELWSIEPFVLRTKQLKIFWVELLASQFWSNFFRRVFKILCPEEPSCCQIDAPPQPPPPQPPSGEGDVAHVIGISYYSKTIGAWFQIFFMFTPIWGNDPIFDQHFWKKLVVETTNSKSYLRDLTCLKVHCSGGTWSWNFDQGIDQWITNNQRPRNP